MLHVFAVFNVHTGELAAIAASVVGAGAAAIQHVGRPLALPGGVPMTIDDLARAMNDQATIDLRDQASGETLMRIERRFLIP